MTALPLIAAISAPIAAAIGYFIGLHRGTENGWVTGADFVRDSLIDALTEHQGAPSAAILRLLIEMRDKQTARRAKEGSGSV